MRAGKKRTDGPPLRHNFKTKKKKGKRGGAVEGRKKGR